MQATRAALNGLLDYAGLFPPAALDLDRVVSNHLSYLASPEQWLLGRLIVPLARLDDLSAILERRGVTAVRPWTISALCPGAEDLESAGDRLARFNERHAAAHVAVVAVETAARGGGDIERIARALPERYERYIELALDDGVLGALRRTADAGCYAKVRTGGLAADAFPSPAALARFIAGCAALETPFKATAGLHHPFRGSYPLTYEPQSACAQMHGFLNLVAASALLYTRRADEDEAARILRADGRAAFGVDGDALVCGGYRITSLELSFSRAHLLRSVGSCSFEDAVRDLRPAGWLE